VHERQPDVLAHVGVHGRLLPRRRGDVDERECPVGEG